MELIHKMKQKIKAIEEENDFIIEDDNEYYFFIGQIAYFIERQSKTSIERCLKSIKLYEDKTNSKILKEYIINRFSIYSYGLNENYNMFTKIFSNILECEPKTNIKKNLKCFYLGVYFKNVIMKFESEEDLNLKKQLSLVNFEELRRIFDEKVI